MSRGGDPDGRETAPRRERASHDRADRATGRVALPRQPLSIHAGTGRQPVQAGRDRLSRVRDSEAQLLATVGAFRVVPTRALEQDRPAESVHAELRHLVDERLLESKTVLINDQPTSVVALTRDGKELLESLRGQGPNESQQQYHAGFVKPRELAHDAQLYNMYQAEAARLQDQGEIVTRVVLDYELKGEYQAHLNRRERPDDETLEQARDTFAVEHGLTVVDGHLELPDLRIEYRTQDGALEYRDLELVTEHYSRSQLAGKARAGFTAYQGGRGGGGVSGGNTRTGGTPFDPHHLEWLK